MWPGLPVCAARALYVALVIFAALGVLVATDREARAQTTEILLSNEGPPPSERLLLVNVTQRHVAQDFTTGPHPGGYGIYAVAVRTETSNGKEDMGLLGRVRSRRWEPVGAMEHHAAPPAGGTDLDAIAPHRRLGLVLVHVLGAHSPRTERDLLLRA